MSRSNCLDIACPIILPQALPGDPGPTGDDGTNGVAIYINTTGTNYASTGTGDQVLVSNSLAANLVAAGDIVDIKSLFAVGSTFVGTIYITYGGTTIATLAVSLVSPLLPVTPTTSTPVVYIGLNTKIYIVSTTSEIIVKEVEYWGNPIHITKVAPTTVTIDTTAIATVVAKATPQVGTATLTSLVLSISKKV